jgi:hypothetical protein
VTILAAGTVTVRGTELERTISYFAPLPSPVLPGELVEMAATGSEDVPAHSGAVRLPPLITIVEPTLDTGLSIDRSTAFEISWIPVDEGTVDLGIGVGGIGVGCSVPAQLGELTVPAEALQRLPATDAATPAILAITQSNHTELSPKGWEIGLYADGFVARTDVALR